jgi:hypothetical protein
LLRRHRQAEQRKRNHDPCELIPNHVNFRLLTRYAADFLGAVSNSSKPLKFSA